MDAPELVIFAPRAVRQPVRSNGLVAPTAAAAANSANSGTPAGSVARWAQRWGLGCGAPVETIDLGVLDCAFKPVRFDDCRTPAATLGEGIAMVSQLGCHANEPQQICCVPEDLASRELFAPCVVCALRPACILEVPCGHVNVCGGCNRDYHTNTRCIRCRERVPTRIDVSSFLDDVTGRPENCRMCQSVPASVVMVPCIHMAFCHRCLPKTVAGCPTCGERVEQICIALLSASSLGAGATAREARFVAGMPIGTFGSLPSYQCPAGRAVDRSGDGLEQTTERVDEEIARLEKQLRRLKHNPPRSGLEASAAAPLPSSAHTDRGPFDAGDFVSPTAHAALQRHETVVNLDSASAYG